MKNFSNIPFSLIGFMYLIIVGILCHILLISEIVKGFLALPAFLIIPYLIGNTSSYGIKYFLKICDAEMNKISKFILYWSIGIIVITLVAIFLEAIFLDISIFNIYFYIGFLGILSLFGIIKDISKNSNNNISQKNNWYIFTQGFPLLLSFLIGIPPAIFITHFSPFPFIYGIDVFIHSFISGTFINYGHLFLDSAYFPIFHILGAIIEIVFNMVPNQIPFLWAARFLTYPLYSIGIYLFFYQLFKDSKLSLLSSIVAVWFTVYNPPFIDIMLYYFTPKIVVWVLFPFFLYLLCVDLISGKKIFGFKNKEVVLLLFIPASYVSLVLLIDHFMPAAYGIYAYFMCFITLMYLFILKSLQNNQLRNSAFILVIVCTASIFFHKPMGLLAVMIILLWLFLCVFIVKYKSLSSPITYLFLLGVILYFFLRFHNIIQFPWISTMYTAAEWKRDIWPDTGDFHYLLNLIMTSYLPVLFIFFCLGIVFTFIRNKHRYLNYSLVVVLFFIIFIYFSPIPFIERILPFFVPFLTYFISFGIINVMRLMHKKYNSIRLAHLFFTLSIVSVVTIAIIAPYMSVINKIVPVTSPYYPYFTFYSEKEYETFKYLDSIVKYNRTIIISDLLTKYVALGVSKKDRFSMLKEYWAFVEQWEMDIFSAKNSKDSYDKINFLLSNKTFTCYWYHVSPQQRCDDRQSTAIIIIHPRTEGGFRVLYPNRRDFKINIENFFDSTYFTPLYNDGEIYIFGVNPEPGVPFKIHNSK